MNFREKGIMLEKLDEIYRYWDNNPKRQIYSLIKITKSLVERIDALEKKGESE